MNMLRNGCTQHFMSDCADTLQPDIKENCVDRELIWRPAIRRCLRWTVVVCSRTQIATTPPIVYHVNSAAVLSGQAFRAKPLRADTHLKSRFSALMMWPYAATLHSFSRQARRSQICGARPRVDSRGSGEDPCRARVCPCLSAVCHSESLCRAFLSIQGRMFSHS